MIDTRTLQSWMRQKKYFDGDTDGIVGPQTEAAFDQAAATVGGSAWPNERQRMATEQLFLEDKGFDVGDVDGLYGAKTEAAHQAYVAKQRDTNPTANQVKHQPDVWPRQKDVPTFYGERGQNQVMVSLPYKIYYEGSLVRRISVHARVAESAKRVFA